jgi:hypothetical protein
MKDFARPLLRFFKIWIILVFSYVIFRFGYNLVFYGWLDFRLYALIELVALPTGQAVIFFLVTWPFAKKSSPDNPASEPGLE